MKGKVKTNNTNNTKQQKVCQMSNELQRKVKNFIRRVHTKLIEIFKYMGNIFLQEW